MIQVNDQTLDSFNCTWKDIFNLVIRKYGIKNMDKTLRTAATGLAAEQKYVEIIANNISNVNTYGFKKVRPEFQDLLYETLQPAGAVSQVGTEPLNEVQIGSGTRLVATTRILSQGDVTQTNNTLDMAINGEGYFMIRKPDNSIAYTRDGSFHLDAQARLSILRAICLNLDFNT
jgi:flagellar basal-body rod protein FlgG